MIRKPTRQYGQDLSVLGFYFCFAVVVTGRLWVDPVARVAPPYPSDPAQVQWFLAHAVRVVLEGANPFFTVRMNAPDGVNLMANTSVLGLGIPVWPVTWLLGPAVSFVLLVTLGLAGTAAAWYWVLSHGFGLSRVAGFVGGGFCGFAPAMMSHASWHPNIVSQFLVPFIVWRVVVLAREGRWLRDGVVLALLVVWQAFINEEILLFTAWAVGVFVVVYGVQRWRVVAPWVGRFVAGLLVTLVVAGGLLVVPLWVQFFGPQHYRGLTGLLHNYNVDLASYFAYSQQSLASLYLPTPILAPNYAEQNAFFGWFLIPALVGVVVALWNNVAVRALAAVAALFAAFSLGSVILFNGRETGIPGPWVFFEDLPLLNSVVPTRFGLVVTAAFGVILAIMTHEVLAITGRGRVRGIAGWAAALAVALIPLTPIPLPATERTTVPQFIIAGDWRPYVQEGQTLVPVPITDTAHPDGLRWAAAVNIDFAIPGGYFLGPEGGVDGKPGRFDAPPTRTALLLSGVALTGQPVYPTEELRTIVREDLRRWGAAILVLPVYQTNIVPLRTTLDGLVGPSAQVKDVWMWDVRSI